MPLPAELEAHAAEVTDAISLLRLLRQERAAILRGYVVPFLVTYALLGPVLPTPTHPENPGLGWDGFARLATGNTLPVFALGGMRPELLATAQAHGAHGIALMRGW